MEKNERLCKVCGSPKRKSTNACSNDLCQYYEAIAVSDQDLIENQNMVLERQRVYLESLDKRAKSCKDPDELKNILDLLTQIDGLKPLDKNITELTDTLFESILKQNSVTHLSRLDIRILRRRRNYHKSRGRSRPIRNR